MAVDLALDHVDHILRNVYLMLADALEVAASEQRQQGPLNMRGIGQDVNKSFALRVIAACNCKGRR